MTEQPRGGREGAAAQVVELASVDGFVVFDLPGAAASAGGTRLAPDVTVAEVALLARAMTYKYGVLHAQMGGAKAGLRGDPADRAGHAELMARYCVEIRPLADAGRFATGPDMGTSEEDFAPLRERNAAPAVISSTVDGVAFEDVVTGYGVAVAAETALAARWGGGCVTQYGRPPGPPARLFAEPANVLVPGTRPGVITGRMAGALPSALRVVAPAANVPYTRAGVQTLGQRGIVALPDFVCNAGAVIGYRSPGEATAAQVLAAVQATIAALTGEVMDGQGGPVAAACARAQAFVRGWWGEPPTPPYAPAAAGEPG